jgi:cell division protein FtsB
MLGKRILLGLLIILNLYLLLTLVWGGAGVFAYRDLKDRHDGLEAELADLEARSRDLSQEIRNLSSNPEHQRQVVRERMNYVGKDELLYVFPETGPSPASEAGHEQ